MTAIQTYLCNGGTAESLESRYGITAKRHCRFENLVLFKYDQIESPMGERIVQECRGIILDESDGWRVVARPFDKFFNHGEGHAAAVDWSTARVQEKVDGSLMTLYWYPGLGEWLVSSSGRPDACGDVNGYGMTFASLFWSAWQAAGLTLPEDRDVAFMFELTSKYNRIVVAHTEPRLTLIGARRRDGVEFPVEQWPQYNPVRSFPLSSISDVERTFETMSPLSQEGYVVVDAAFRRIKVKHPGYVAIHHLKDGFGPKRMVEIIRMGETSELLAHFPEWREEFDVVSAKFNELARQIDADYAEIRDIPVQKDFALRATKMTFPAALFQMRNGRAVTAKAYLASMTIKGLLEALGMRGDEEVADAA